MKRVAFIIDGLNLYHSIERRPHWHGFKWLDLRALANAFIKPSSEVIVDVCFCTSSPTWNLNKLNRHNLLLKAYLDLGIRVVKGDIRKTKRDCRATCLQEFEDHEEKQTDINVAVEVLRGVMGGTCDKVFLVSGDSDQIPTVKFFHEKFPDKELVIVIPPGEMAENLRQTAKASAQITLVQLKRSMLSEPHVCKDGMGITKPCSWFNKTSRPPFTV